MLVAVGILSLLISAPVSPDSIESPEPTPDPEVGIPWNYPPTQGWFNKISPSNGSPIQGESVTLSWSISSTAASYEYCYDTINDNACSSWKSNGSSTSITIGDLKKGQEYFWHVRAVNSERIIYSDGDSSVYWSFLTQTFGSPPPTYTNDMYLPILLDQGSPSPPIVLKGRVTYKGIAEAFTVVELVYFNGHRESTYATKDTNQKGKYKFDNLPPLSGDQYYYVRKINDQNDPSWLSSWYCMRITAATIDPNLFQCDFDLENVNLISPYHEAWVPLPQSFIWSKRVTRSDSYVFHLSDMSDNDPLTPLIFIQNH